MKTHSNFVRLTTALATVSLLGACATQKPYDYSAFRESRPKSILVLPPINHSPDVKGTYGVLSQVTLPLAESGYYVLPVALVDETFRNNGLQNPSDIHGLPLPKLQEIFGADAVLYINIEKYGTSYEVIMSEAAVAAEGRLVDLKTGKELWSGKAFASSMEGQSSGGGLMGLLVTALVNQIVNTATDSAFPIAGIASQRLLAAGRPNGMLYGPRSPHYGKDGK